MARGFRFGPVKATLPRVRDSTVTRNGTQRLTANESWFWHAESVRGQFHPWYGAMVVLAREPEADELERALARAMEQVPRLRHRVAARGFGISLPEWRTTDLVDTRYHVRRLRLQADADLPAALGALSVIGALPMDRGRPLWECYMLGPLVGGRAICLLKFHAALIDSVEATDVIAALGTQGDGRRARRARTDANGGLLGAGVSLARDGLRRTWQVARGAARVSAGALRHPVNSLESAWRGARSLPDVVSDAAETVAREFDGVVASKPVRSFDVLSIPTATLERTARPLAVALEDLLLGALTAALRALKPPAARRVVDTVCVARLQRERLGHDAPSVRGVFGSLALPIGERREARRLALIRDSRHGLCEDLTGGMSPWLPQVIGVLPRVPGGWVAGLGIGKPTASFVDGGSIESWDTLAGVDVEAGYCFADLADAATLGAAVLRCGPLVHVGIVGDASLPTDSRSFHGLFDTALQQMEALADRFTRGGKRYAAGVAADVDC
jgi:diacylglycerol O-acyltransferase